MIFFIGDKKVELSERELRDRYIDHGEEGIVYQYGNEAVKFYTDRMKYKRRLTENDIHRFKQIKTKRILLPKKPVYDKDRKFIGYTTDFKIEALKERIGILKMDVFVREFELIEDDIRELSKNLVKLQDLNYGGLIMTQDGIYIGDPGEYHFNDKSFESSLYDYNIDEMNYFVTRVVLDKYLKLTKKEKEALRYLFPASDDYFLDVIKRHGYKPEQKANGYFKKMCLESINK